MSGVRMPNAFLAQSTVQMKREAAKAAKLTNKFPIGQILYFHEQRLAVLENKTPPKLENDAILQSKVEHLEKLYQQLVREMQQLKLSESENNVQLEVSEENDSAEEEEEEEGENAQED